MNNELYHHGIKGQKWGVRRFQNKDGTLTSAGKQRYSHNSDGRLTDKGQKKFDQDRWKQERRDFTDTMTKGQKFAQASLLGPSFTYTYNSLRTAGYSPKVAAGNTYVSGLLGGPIGQAILATKVANEYKKDNYGSR